MSDSLITDYIAATKDFQEAVARLNQYADLLAEVSNHLRADRPKMSFSNIGVGLPAEAALSGISVDGSAWPSAEQIQTAIGHFYSTEAKMRDTWQRIPSDQKTALHSPNDVA